MKRGQLEISFGMIFSVIIIIVILATSFYVIQYFMQLSKCTSIGLFYEALDQEIDTAWKGTTSRTLFNSNIPGSVEYVCFGNMTSTPKAADRERYDELRRLYRLSESNVFLYPIQTSCSAVTEHKLKHVNSETFFCVQQNDNKVKVSIEKEAFDSFVTLGSDE